MAELDATLVNTTTLEGVLSRSSSGVEGWLPVTWRKSRRSSWRAGNIWCDWTDRRPGGASGGPPPGARHVKSELVFPGTAASCQGSGGNQDGFAGRATCGGFVVDCGEVGKRAAVGDVESAVLRRRRG
jgi:hypothetical protein